MVWVYLALLVISLFVAASASKGTNAKPPSLTDFDAPTAEEGRAVVEIFGTGWVDDYNWLWYGDLSTSPIKASGGK